MLISQLIVKYLSLSQDSLLSLRIKALGQVSWVAVETGLLFADGLSLNLLDYVLPYLVMTLILGGHRPNPIASLVIIKSLIVFGIVHLFL